MTDIAGVVLMGGQSTRMGKDKSTIIWKNDSLLNHQYQLIKSVCKEAYLSINSSQISKVSPDYPCIVDEYDEIGPIGGIFTCLNNLKSDLLVIPIDMPLLSKDLLLELCQSSMSSCFKTNNQLEPFPSYWSIKTLDTINESINSSNFSISNVMKEAGFSQISTHHKSQFANMNYPQDLR